MNTLNSPQAPAAIGPYVQAKQFGDLVFLSGQLPIDAATGEMPASAGAQATQSLANVAHILATVGLSAADVVKTTVFVKDLNDFAEINEAYAAFFAGTGTFPARSCIEVARIPKDALVEIEVIAGVRRD
ncbi:Rid family detoxifying hydrolase [Jeongeupia sp. USM3]|uniref:Rid family detoxifying hydrolase n=1 Tax=Jeongeupia sp. USM3 TaxID=1906741 RepID=UPI00089DDF8D|nr:Rid family detoxifying hydrolase [Jeongeupia sp. USM3]AOY00722.1 reactive intermediate/imine deaminase [Jeongeupia sp. USM3]